MLCYGLGFLFFARFCVLINFVFLPCISENSIMNDDIAIDKQLDTSGLLCPEPVMMLHSAVRDLEEGKVLQVLATDPSTTRDIPKFCRFLGHELLQQKELGQSYQYLIRIGS